MIKLRHALVVTLAAALVGCGQAAPNRPKASKNAVRTMAAQQPGMGLPGMALPGALGQAPPPGVDGGKGVLLLAAVRKRVAEMTGFEAKIMTKTQGYYKQGERQSELRKVSIGYKVTWAKPAKFRAEVFNSPDPMMEGAGMVTTDGMNITARAKGLLSFVPIKLTARDPKLGNARNHTFDKYGPNAQIERLTGPTAVWTIIGESVAPNGLPMAFVQIDGVRRLDAQITREVFGLETASLALRSLAAFEGETKVVDYNFQEFRWNPKTTSETFKM